MFIWIYSNVYWKMHETCIIPLGDEIRNIRLVVSQSDRRITLGCVIITHPISNKMGVVLYYALPHHTVWVHILSFSELFLYPPSCPHLASSTSALSIMYDVDVSRGPAAYLQKTWRQFHTGPPHKHAVMCQYRACTGPMLPASDQHRPSTGN